MSILDDHDTSNDVYNSNANSAASTMVATKPAPLYTCNICDYTTSKKSSYDKHLHTAKHTILTDPSGIATKPAQSFVCNSCHYTTSKKSSYDFHLTTAKHKKLTTANKTGSDKLTCSICKKKYNSRPGLWAHKKKCSAENAKKKEDEEKETETKPVLENTIVYNDRPNILTEIIARLYNDNQEIRSLVLEQQKKADEERRQNQEKADEERRQNKEKAEEERRQNQEKAEKERRENKDLINKLFEMTQQQLTVTNNNITNLNTINNNNQRFNLNVFLNETCKDAMNLDEFLDTIRPTFDELLVMGDVGFVSGISDIFIKRLRALDITKRPIHCTDAKRETIFLKENNVWTKDDNGHSRLNSIIEKVEYRNVVCLHQWCLDNPDAMVNNHEKNLLRDKIYLQTLLGDPKTREKVVRNIAKEVALDREAIMLQFGRK